MFFDWQRFCDMHQIPYVTKGHNTMRGHITIRCPLCADDPSQHLNLNINPRRPGWSCFRDSRHKGADPTRLVRALLSCGHDTARALVQQQRPEPDDFDKAADKLLSKPKEEKHTVEKPQRLKMPSEFKPLWTARSSYAEDFLQYLGDRGFHPPRGMAQLYGLHYVLSGKWRRRLIIPFFVGGRLVGWTGRSIDKNEKLRYLTLPNDPRQAQFLGCDPALVSMDDYVWWKDRVELGGDKLVITEGPFDALKLDWHYPPLSFEPSLETIITCCFGMPKRAQIDFLGRAAKRYNRVLVVLDSAAAGASWRLAMELSELSGVSVQAVTDYGTKDPGEMNRRQVREVLSR